MPLFKSLQQSSNRNRLTRVDQIMRIGFPTGVCSPNQVDATVHISTGQFQVLSTRSIMVQKKSYSPAEGIVTIRWTKNKRLRLKKQTLGQGFPESNMLNIIINNRLLSYRIIPVETWSKARHWSGPIGLGAKPLTALSGFHRNIA